MGLMSGGGWWLDRINCSLVLALGIGFSPVLMPWAIASEKPTDTPHQEGIYLYGEASTTHQVGKGYVIFTQSGQRVVGALYAPQSEYSCFIGKRTQTQLNVNILEPIAQGETSEGSAFDVAIPKLHAIANIGAAERQLLATCQQEALALEQNGIKTSAQPIRSKVLMR
jgi:hypothetical protein